MNFEVVKQRRSAAPHRSMFLRMLIRAAVLRRGRAAAALLAMVVAAGVTTFAARTPTSAAFASAPTRGHAVTDHQLSSL